MTVTRLLDSNLPSSHGWAIHFAKVAHPEPYREFYEPHFPEIVGRQPDSSGFISVRCLNSLNHQHGDKKPSAAVNVKSGVYHCSVCGSFSPFRFLTEILGLPKDEASFTLDQYRFELRFEDKPAFEKVDNYSSAFVIPPKGFNEYASEAAKRLSPDLEIVQEYLAARGINYELLTRYRWGYVPEGFVPGQEECIVVPFIVNGRVVGIRGRARDGRKGGAKGSRFVLWNLDALEGHDQAVIVEGESDALRTIQALESCGIDVPVLSVPGATFRREWEREFQGIHTVYLIPQADDPSWNNFVANAVKVLGDYRCVVVKLPWKRGEAGKDVCDWLRLHSDAELAELIPWRKTRSFFTTHKEMLELAEQEIPWLINGLIASGDKVLVGGPQKAMKTFFILNLIRAAVSGEDFLEYPGWSVRKPCKVLCVEEEGSPVAFARRIKRLLSDIPPDSVRWVHRQGVKLDNPYWVDKLIEVCEDYQPDLIIFDPLQRIHSKVEDRAWEMGEVWDRLHELVLRFPDAAVLVVHHFGKRQGVDTGWDAFRGSSRSSGEADVGIFLEKTDKTNEATGDRILYLRLDGRDIPPLTDSRGRVTDRAIEVYVNPETFKMTTTGFVVRVEDTSTRGKVPELIKQSGENGIAFKDIVQELGVSEETVRRYIRELQDRNMPITEEGGKGQKPKIYRWVGKQEKDTAGNRNCVSPNPS